MNKGERPSPGDILDPRTFLAELSALSRRAGLYVNLGIGGELTLSAVGATTRKHWPFYWDRAAQAYQFSPEDGLDEP